MKKRTTIRRAKPEKPDTIYTLYELRILLNRKRKDFCLEYIRNGWNGTRAYMKVYKLTNENSAAVLASILLRNIKIQQFIAFMKENLEEVVGLSKAKQLRHYMVMAYSSIAKLHKDWITLEKWKTLQKEHPEILDIIEDIESKTETYVNGDKELKEVHYVKIKMPSRIAAMREIDNLMDYKASAKMDIKISEQPLFPDI